MKDTLPIVDSIMARLAHEGLGGYEVFRTCSLGLATEVKRDIDVFEKSESARLSVAGDCYKHRAEEL